MSNPVGRLFVVATPIGNLDDITLRAITVLQEVDRILAEDTRHSRRLLDHLGIDRPMLAMHEHNEREVVERGISLLEAGESLAMISDAGTPLISDPGFPLVRACRERGLAVIPVPGACALIAALSVSGLPTDRFRFEGFLARKSAARLAQLRALQSESASLIFYESSHRVLAALKDILTTFGPNRRVVLARELTKRFETIRSEPIDSLLTWVEADEDQQRGEFVLVVEGNSAPAARVDTDTDTLLRALLEEMPVKPAAALAAKISGEKKNALYQRALTLAAH